uniref:Uncharacterized protein n=1 Tax=Parvoviridae sp. TaxID=1940570 RepID=A0A7D3UH34_9VIRU|nr:MAG: hypothetical protein [Parvoviridae sp.]
MKRASEGGDAGGSKKQASDGGGSGGGAAATLSEKTQPIERPFRISTIHLTFNQITWEEVGAGEMKYLPLSQTPYYMLGPEHLNLFNKYRNLWTTLRIHQPKARISNLIMLQDDLINQGGTPLETTAFTQVCYMLQYCPKKQTQFFKLGNIRTCKAPQYDEVTYNMSANECSDRDIKQLVTVNGFQDFEHLGIFTAKVDKYAGYDPYGTVTINPDFTQIRNTYIPPNDRTIGVLANYAANLQPDERGGDIAVDTYKQITWARNSGNFKLLKVNDTSEIPIVTNIADMPLINDPLNDFTKRTVDISDTETGNLYTYYTEFCWPSNNRPYFSRKDNLNNITPYESNKSLTPIQHNFFCMPPIRKANGALLKQRCSFMLEQEFSVTLQFSEGVWDDGDDATSKYILNQHDGIILRPNVYGTTQKAPAAEGAFCSSFYDYECSGEECPISDTYQAMSDAMGQYEIQNPGQLFNWTSKPEFSYIDYKQTLDNDYFDWNNEMQTKGFKDAWETFKNNNNSGVRKDFRITPSIDTKKFTEVIIKGYGTIYEIKNIEKAQYVLINGPQFDFMKQKLGIYCSKKPTAAPQRAGTYKPVTRNTNIFYV